MSQSGKEKPSENMLLNILINIVIPTLIMTKLNGEEQLGPQLAIVVALLFPIGYGIRDFILQGRVNLFSALGFISILLTGGISLLELDPKYIAIKEASIPGILGLATLLSVRTKYPLVKVFLYNDKIMHIDKVDEQLEKLGNQDRFNRALSVASGIVALSFLVSSILNYALAKYLLVSPPGTPEYTAELGKMTALSFPVIAVPATLVMIVAMFYLFRQITRLTQLTLEEIINA